METDPVATSSPGRSGSDKSYVATGGVAQKQGRGFPAIQPRKNGKTKEFEGKMKTIIFI